VIASHPYRSWVEISREQIASNFRAVRDAVGPDVEVTPVVKADAYRHGAAEVSRVLESVGARWLAVSNVEEGVALREAGRNARILVMADFLPFGREAAAEHNLTPVLHSLDEIPELETLAKKLGRPLPYHLKFDSGMGRLGTCASSAEIVEAVTQSAFCRLEGLMSHFASPADFEKEQTDRQIRCFQSLAADLERAGIRPRYLHMSSTNAIVYGRRAAWLNMVRPGHAIYGYVSPAKGPAPQKEFVVRPVLEWKAVILTVKDVPEGSLIGYGGIFRAPKPMRIGVLAAGYADGIPHRLSNRGRVIAGGKFAPILGAVSMDLTTIDLTEAPGLAPGDTVTLLGREGDACQDAQQMARAAGTISYSVLCGISSRVKRVYV
jgi:alanine racemase